MTLAQIVYKNSQGIELTIEERVLYLEYQVRSLMNSNKEPEAKKGPPYTVENIYFVNDYVYKGMKFNRFMVQLQGYNDLYTMDKLSTTVDKVEKDDLIYCKFEGDKLKDVKVLYDV
jgi:hypothetical protein